MAWRFNGHAEVNPRAPVSFAICDRCSRQFNINMLSWQWQWAGPRLQNTRFLVCRSCMDVPQPQLKPRILPPDPHPTLNARPENFLVDDFNYQVTQNDEITVAQDDVPLVGQNEANNREDPT